MRLDAWLSQAQRTLVSSGVATARLDALVLLEDCLGRNRTLLLAHPEDELSLEHISTLEAQIARRSRHEPLAYIRGKSEFYGREFSVNNNVLEPRPESETMIDMLKQLVKSGENVRLADIGSGSGCLGITAALELDLSKVYLHDIDPATLDVARQNAVRHGVQAEFITTDLLAGAPTYDIIVANLPYVPDEFKINTAAGHEPRLALFGGPDGLDLYRRMFGQISAIPKANRPRYVLTEALPPQHEQLSSVAKLGSYRQILVADFIQLFEVNLV